MKDKMTPFRIWFAITGIIAMVIIGFAAVLTVHFIGKYW